uniref:Putative acetyltransferase n=2 Tax=environmental samples TaxID=651140 RepID=A0A075HTD7_9ARCH|nr:putative acetyltransferase [uncultured marine thaumarchaeote KM3_84_D12]AIF19204.1 putative acetyltransferase [uncultured marine thaumarchaeote KM3_86_B06]
MKKIIIFGTGELAQRIFFYLQDSDDQVIAFCANKSKIDKDELLGLPVHAFENIEEKFPPNEFSMFIALAYSEMNKKRTKFFNEAKKKGYELYSYIHPSTKIWNKFEIGENCFILANNVIQPFVKIGNNVLIGSNNLISHNTSIGDNCFITSNVTMGGHIVMGKNCFVGLSSTINQRIKIGNECIIGAGTIISKNTNDNEVYAENSSKKLPQSSDQISDMI